ncbi:tRNA pseudouridine(38-40) synthase TruA [Campylobacter sp. RM16188]|uniref:tRNA pseudouridine(38-40) synthase TruA n=1 Tax=Campylobacter sp. RM16188 TaxID=1705725 RepID=UPI001551E340|nr:tRNA pseudouridine(38-40) synthase TruA [Campylobacter sp. RM16188]
MKIKLIFSYDGSKFQGSQTQPHENGVEDILSSALAHVGIFSKIISSSRTDKDVHANNQVACVECGEHFKDFKRLANLINRHAHPHIHIKQISKVDKSFHPRYDAKFRQYRYIINHGEFSPFLSQYHTFLPKFDLKKANELLELFIGEHDFRAFMKLGSEVKSPVRKITKAFCYSLGEKTIIVFKANGFLRAQIRLMIASVFKALELAQIGKLNELRTKNESQFTRYSENLGVSANLSDTTDINSIQDKNFKKAKELLCKAIYDQKAITRMPAPPNGLYLNRVFY